MSEDRTIQEQLSKYLADAHSIEIQAKTQLKQAPAIAGDPELAEIYRNHLSETEGHERSIDELLAARGASSSRVKDTIMAVGGMGFVLFARLQPDTPGKLHAHSLSYEALELSSYELLALTAEIGGEEDVAAVARSIAQEEQAMIERLEAHYDQAAEASLKEKGAEALAEDLKKYLADAHAIEAQAETMLERAKAPEAAGAAQLAEIYSEHLEETRRHKHLVEERLQALGGDPSSLKDAAMRMGAIEWGAFFEGHPDTPGKLACFTRAFEYLEIGGYEQLRRVAERAGDQETAALAAQILAEERAAQAKVADAFPEAVRASLGELGVKVPASSAS